MIDTYLKKNVLDINNFTDGAEEEIIANAFGAITGNEKDIKRLITFQEKRRMLS